VTSIALVGDCTTTTALAVAAGWPESERDLIIFEADPTGGSLAAWLDTPLSPSLSAVVTALHASPGSTPAAMRATLDSLVRRSDAGIRFVPAPFRTREARSAVNEAERSLLPLIEQFDDAINLLDLGRIDPGRVPIGCRHAAMSLVCHRQDASSAPAATVRLERLAESVEALRATGHNVGIVLIGNEPFALDEILEFAAPEAPGWELAVDPLAAAVFAGRSGVSARRLARLPLVRSASHIASGLNHMLGPILTRAADGAQR